MAASAFRHPITLKTCKELMPRRKKYQVGYQSDASSIRELKFLGSSYAYALLTLFSSVSETNTDGNGSSILFIQEQPTFYWIEENKALRCFLLLLSSSFINSIYLQYFILGTPEGLVWLQGQ